ncbi:MAG TPA: hypothetical protein VFQ92_16280 [Blastocatellia bacterium]|nr:hypothetical protein [Blastocatellia bacterium]
MNRPGERIFFTFSLLAFVVAIFCMTLGLGRAARMVPLAVAVPTMCLLAFQLVLDLSPRLARKYSSLEKKDLFKVEPLREKSSALTESEQPAEEPTGGEKESNVFLWLLVMLASLFLFGLLVGLPLYVFLYLKLRTGEGWLISSAMAAGVLGLLSLIFIFALRARLYEGELWGWLGM